MLCCLYFSFNHSSCSLVDTQTFKIIIVLDVYLYCCITHCFSATLYVIQLIIKIFFSTIWSNSSIFFTNILNIYVTCTGLDNLFSCVLGRRMHSIIFINTTINMLKSFDLHIVLTIERRNSERITNCYFTTKMFCCTELCLLNLAIWLVNRIKQNLNYLTRFSVLSRKNVDIFVPRSTYG